MPYDPKCRELANHFLAEDAREWPDGAAEALALHLQEAAEWWLEWSHDADVEPTE